MYIFFFFLLFEDNVERRGSVSRRPLPRAHARPRARPRAREVSANETQLIIGKSGLPARGGSDRGVLFLRVIN